MTRLGLQLRHFTAWMAFFYTATGDPVVATTTVQPENPSSAFLSEPVFPTNLPAGNETPTDSGWSFPLCPATENETAVSPSHQRMLQITLDSFGPTLFGMACVSVPLNAALIFIVQRDPRRLNRGRVEVIFLTVTDILVALAVIAIHGLQRALPRDWPLNECYHRVFTWGHLIGSVATYSNRVAMVQIARDRLRHIGADHPIGEISTCRWVARLTGFVLAYCGPSWITGQAIPEILAYVGWISRQTAYGVVLVLSAAFCGWVSTTMAILTYQVWRKINQLKFNFKDQESGKEGGAKEGVEAAKEKHREETVSVGLNGRVTRVESSDGHGYKVTFSKGNRAETEEAMDATTPPPPPPPPPTTTTTTTTTTTPPPAGVRCRSNMH